MGGFLVFGTGFYLVFVIIIIIGLFRLPSPEHSEIDLPKVSVIIAARNEEKNLPRLLDDLVQQTIPIEKLEIIIANDRSTDNTASIVEDFISKYPFIRLINISDLSNHMAQKKHALTQASNASQGEIIVSTDADCRVPKTWILNMVTSVQNSDTITVGYSKVSGQNYFFHQYQMIDFLALMTTNAGASGLGFNWGGSGQNLAYRKKDFDTIGGFEPVKDQISGDDLYLVQNISKLKPGVFNVDPESFVTTLPAKSLIDFINQRIRWSSNSKTFALETNVVFFFSLLIPFLFHFFIPIAIFLQVRGIILAILLKFILDGLAIFLGGKLFRTVVNPVVFMFWFCIQPLYIPFIGIAGLVGKYSWKT